jgi:hypothetical protein
MSRRERYCAFCTLGVLGDVVLEDGGFAREVTTLCVVKSVLTSSREMRGDGERLRREGSSFVVSSSVVLFLQYAVSIDEDDDDDDIRSSAGLFLEYVVSISCTATVADDDDDDDDN